MNKELSNDAKEIIRFHIELWKWICLGSFVGWWSWRIYNLYLHDNSKLKVDFANFIVGFIMCIIFLAFLLLIWKCFTEWKININNNRINVIICIKELIFDG